MQSAIIKKQMLRALFSLAEKLLCYGQNLRMQE
jgi:hypothetical protein